MSPIDMSDAARIARIAQYATDHGQAPPPDERTLPGERDAPGGTMTVVKVVWRAGEMACSLGNWLLSQAALHSDDEPFSPASQDAGEELLSDMHSGHDEPQPWCSRCQEAYAEMIKRLKEDSEYLEVVSEPARVELMNERDQLKAERDELDASRGALLRSLDNILSVTGSSCATEAIGVYKRLKAELAALPELYDALGVLSSTPDGKFTEGYNEIRRLQRVVKEALDASEQALATLSQWKAADE